MSVRREPNHPISTILPPQAIPVARRALDETRLRGLPVAEEYRVIADRLYRAGFRDMPPGSLVAWIEETVQAEYEHFLELRRLGDRLCSAIAAGDHARAAWEIACDLSPNSRARLIEGIRKLNEVEGGQAGV